MSNLILIKFNDERYIESLRDNGEIYMRPLTDFKKCGSNKERQDGFEGVSTNEYFKDGFFEFKVNEKDKWKKLNLTEAHLNQYNEPINIFSYSLYIITEEDLMNNKILKIDPRMKEFGSHLLIIRFTRQFLSRIQKFFEANNLKYKMGPVEYYDNKSTQENLTYFHKPNTHEHQKEYRIIVQSNSTQALKFSIGNIDEFSEVYRTHKLENFCIKKYQQSNNQGLIG